MNVRRPLPCLLLGISLMIFSEGSSLLAGESRAVSRPSSSSTELTTSAMSEFVVGDLLAEVGPISPFEDGLIAERVNEDENCQFYLKRLSEGGKKVWRRLEKEADRLGRMPSLPEYAELLVETDAVITKNDRGALFFCFGKIQRTPISARELSALFRKQRAAMKSLSIEYQVRYVVPSVPIGGQANPETRALCKFITDGDRLFYRRTEFKGETFLEEETETFDGDILRTLLRFPSGTLNGSLMELDWRSRFYGDGNPLVCARLINSPVEYGLKREFVDLALAVRSQFAYETPVAINGIECRAFGSFDRQYYCSPAHSHALVAVRMGGAEYDQNQQRHMRDGNRNRVLNSEFVEVAEDVWLPRKSETMWIRNGKVTNLFRVDVDKYKINRPVDTAVFEDLIPDGAHVADALRNETYIQGE